MFIGHKNDLQIGQSKSIEFFENKKNLINDNGTYKIGSNICPHQNSRIINGVSSELRCQYHGWSWNNDGTPKDSGSSTMCNNHRLHMKPVYEYKGLLFEQEINLSILDSVSFENFQLQEFRVDNVDAAPEISMDIFLDVDHIPVVHNGVYDLLGIQGRADVKWDYADWGSIQTVTDESNKVIARWIAIYPYTMIEWQSGSLFITQSFDSTKMAVWKYKDINDTDTAYKLNSAMWENAFTQDKAQAEQMVRFPSANLEESKKHYRNWINK